MISYKQYSFSEVFYYCFVFLLIYIAIPKVQSLNHPPALYLFGDSFTDCGNNNHTSTLLKCNFPPYGRDFINHTPTGRFTNGLLIPDFIAAYLGAKSYPHAYLDPKLSLEDMMIGVSFGYGGSGFDPLTPLIDTSMIPITKQLEYFEELKSRLGVAIGATKADDTIERAFIFVTGGTNDFIVNYFNHLTPSRRNMFTIPSYQKFLVQQARQLVQGLLRLGVQRIAFMGLPPLGCIPAVITLYSNSTENVSVTRKCVEKINVIATGYNSMLKNELRSMEIEFHNSKIAYIDFYGPIIDIVKNPFAYGFTEVNKGCCGTGIIDVGPLCNPKSVTCPDASKYIFWDSVHLTEKAYSLVFKANQNIIHSLIN